MPMTRSQRQRVGDKEELEIRSTNGIHSAKKQNGKGQISNSVNNSRQKRGINEEDQKEETGKIEAETDGLSSENDSDGSSSSSSSESESDEDKDEASGSSDEEDALDALFQKSIASLQANEQSKPQKGLSTGFEDNEDLVRLDGDDDEEEEIDNKKKHLKTNSNVRQRVKKNKKSRTGIPDKQIESAFNRLERGEELGDNKPKSVRQKKRESQQEREKTAGSKWFGMPAFPGAKRPSQKNADERSLINPKGLDGDGRGPTAEEMRREVQAIRLRNAIDPKRFYRGSVKGESEMPKYAQLGKIISGNADAASTMTREQRGKTVIEELMRDSDNTNYAKRKYDEQQSKANVGWSSHVRRHQKRKRGGVK